MNSYRMHALFVTLATALIPNIADAFYAAHLGRWTSRDPIADRIGASTPLFGGSFASRDALPDAIQIHSYATKLSDSMQEQTRNLYEYTGGNPVIRADPSGLLFGWNYGNYCGWSRRGPDKPIDDLDKACQDHDQCQATWLTCNPYHIIKCSVKLCLDADRAEDSGCKANYPGQPGKQQECESAARQIQLLFCPVGITNPERDLSNPRQCCPGKL